jgi:hypothetical protein
MQPFEFVDARGRAWHVYDYVVSGWGSSARKHSLVIGDRNAKSRAFVPVGRQGAIMVYALNHGSWHGTESLTLESQLHYSKPLHATAGERLNGQ